MTESISALKIPLTKGKFALIDKEDYQKVCKYKWSFNGRYATRGIYLGKINGKRKYRTQTLHVELMETPKGMETDHINGDSLDNRRSNLRICTHKQNLANSKKRSFGKTFSNYKGAYWNKSLKKWYSNITLYGKTVRIGSFKTEIEAAKAYDKKAREYYGEFARTNF